MLKKLFLLSASSFFSLSSFAESAHHTFNLSANIKGGCLISTNNINFGAVEGIVTGAKTPVNINALCSKGISYTIKTAVADKVESPSNKGQFFAYIHPLYYINDPVIREYVGYRLRMIPSEYSSHPNIINSYLGDGSVNYSGTQSSYIIGTGSGNLQTITLQAEYYTYIPLKAGTYLANTVFNLDY